MKVIWLFSAIFLLGFQPSPAQSQSQSQSEESCTDLVARIDPQFQKLMTMSEVHLDPNSKDGKEEMRRRIGVMEPWSVQEPARCKRLGVIT
jgi:hypothetical protein